MANLNRVELIGNLGQDFELRHTRNGVACGSFSMAMTERYKNAAGELQEHTEWARVSIFGKLAVTIKDFLKKGRQVYVEGPMRTRDYETAEGEKRRITEVRARNVQLLGPAPQSTSSVAGAGNPDAGKALTPPDDVRAVPVEEIATEAVDIDEADDIPF